MTSSPSPSLHLPTPETGRDEAERFVAEHLDGLFCEDTVVSSPTFRGGQSAADVALDRYSVTGYAKSRNEAYPVTRRGASRLSPYIRHGLLSLGRVWDAVEGGPYTDVKRFRNELLWQEYARHWYARLGPATGSALRKTHPDYEPDYDPDYDPTQLPAGDAAGDSSGDAGGGSGGGPFLGPVDGTQGSDGWDQEMACLELTVGELEEEGWLVNQTRMWLASHWTVRSRQPWRQGEDFFFRHLLDGSRAANRLGWQWTTGIGSNRAYGFSRWQVEKRAPGLCASCEVAVDCPIYTWPDEPELVKVEANPLIGATADMARHYGPRAVHRAGLRIADGDEVPQNRREEPDAVWLTAESLGVTDPALAANPDLPAVFVFDRPLLVSLQLSSKRLVFLVETLAELALHRSLEVHLGDPARVLRGRPLATTFAPVPGWRRRAGKLDVVEVHPWPWLRTPTTGTVGSFSAWSKRTASRVP